MMTRFLLVLGENSKMLELKVIGCFGSKAKNKKLPTYILLDASRENYLALDAGSLCSLSLSEQLKVKDILLTHSHFDHCLDLPMLAYNNSRLKRTSFVHSSQETNTRVKKALFTPPAWIPFDELGAIKFLPLVPANFNNYNHSENNYNPSEETNILGFQVNAISVEHNNEGVGYLVSKKDVSLFYTGDTGMLEKEFWKRLWQNDSLKAIIIECTYPNELKNNASNYAHLCPEMLKQAIEMLSRPDVKFLATHFLPEHEATIKSQLDELKRSGINLSWLDQGKTYQFG